VLKTGFPPDVDALKIEIPSDATPTTPWEITRVSRRNYFEPLPPKRDSWEAPARMGYRTATDPHTFEPDSDVYAMAVKRVVSVSPLSLDMTSRLAPGDFDRLLRQSKR